jgi:type VI secretion system ImpB/VipA family protein
MSTFSFGSISFGLTAGQPASGQPLKDGAPFRMLLMSDWSGRASRGDTSGSKLSARKTIEVDRDNLDEVLAGLKVTIHLPLAGADRPPLEISFNEFDDFLPDKMFERLDLFQSLAKLRRRLKNNSTFAAAADEVRALMPAAAPAKADPAKPAAASAAGGNVLDQIIASGKTAAAKPGGSDFAAFLSRIVEPHMVTTVHQKTQDGMIEVVDQLVGAQMRAVLHHPIFQELESAWRALYYLVRRLDTDEGLKLVLVDVTRAELVADLGAIPMVAAAEAPAIPAPPPPEEAVAPPPEEPEEEPEPEEEAAAAQAEEEDPELAALLAELGGDEPAAEEPPAEELGGDEEEKPEPPPPPPPPKAPAKATKAAPAAQSAPPPAAAAPPPPPPPPAAMVEDLTKSGLFQLVVEKSVGTPGAPVWSVLAGNYTFGPTVEDASLLGRLSKIAAAAGAPFLAAGSTELFGCPSVATTPDPDDWKARIPAEVAEAWAALRKLAEINHVGLIAPRFLVRVPYGKETEPTEQFEFEEVDEVPKHEDFLWANPAFAAAYLLGAAYNKEGSGFKPGQVQDMGKLPMFFYEDDGDKVVKPIAEAWLTVRAAEKIAKAGLMALMSIKGQEAVRLAEFRSLAEGSKPLAGRWK